MRKIKDNIFIYVGLCVLCISVGTAVSFVVHELSHLLMLVILGGDFDEFSLFGEMFVGGNVDYQHISIIALGSIFIPFLISAVLSLMKNKWVCIFNAGFSVQTILNIILGFYAHFFIKDISTQNTYDLALACNFFKESWIILILCGVISIIQVKIMMESLKTIHKNI